MSEFQSRAASDVSVFTDPTGFGTQATFVFGDVSKPINVLFEENYSGHDEYGREVSNIGPMVFCSTADILDADGNEPGEDEENTATLTINETIYTIIKCARDGDGSFLTLTKQ